MEFPLALTFDDVALVPQYNNVPSRTEPDTSTWLTREIQAGMPLIPANMDTVIGSDLAKVICANGGIPIFHRFTSLDQQAKWIEEFDGRVFLSSGLNKWEELTSLLDRKPLGVVLDVAHGHSEMMISAIRKIKSKYPHIQVIAGNVCTPLAYQDLANAGADAIKLGIGPGAACSTRIVTGFGVPQFSTIYECGKVAQKLRVPIIADGGIRNSRDVVLALAAGASTVMVGKLFALTEESAAEKRERRQFTPASTPIDPEFIYVGDTSNYYLPHNHSVVQQAKYRGQASADFQNEFYGGLKEKTVAEGTDFWAPVSGPAQKVIDGLLGGLRSGLTYGGARNIKELQRKAEFVRVSSTYMAESRPREG